MSNPRLHQSIAKILIQECPAIAYLRHREMGDTPQEQTAAMGDGLIFEALITGYGVEKIALIDYPDFRTKAAQEEKAAALENGLVPMLARKFAEYESDAEAIREQIMERFPALFAGEFQRYLEWQSDGVECAGTLDCLIMRRDTHPAFIIADLKKAASVAPRAIQRTAGAYGWDIQAAAYLEAVEALHPELAGRGEFLNVTYQTEPIPIVQVYKLTGEFLHIGRQKWDHAKRLWKACIAANEWPAYGDGVIPLSPLPWHALEAAESVVTSNDLDEVFPCPA